jgi:hypothetical protein
VIVVLRIFFVVVLGSMLAVTSWASVQVPLWSVPREVATHPWFIATLVDAYWGFFTFFAWQCYKEPSWASRALWLLALVLLGNIAMAVYGLLVTFRLPAGAGAAHVLLRRAPMSPLVPAALVMIIAGVGAVTAFL